MGAGGQQKQREQDSAGRVPDQLCATQTIAPLSLIHISWWAQQPGFALVDVWYLSVASVGLQAGVSLLMLRRQFRLRLA